MMYQQPNHSYSSADSLRRLSSNNPFRNQLESTRVTSTSSSNSNGSVNLVKSPQSKNFESWVEKNKKLIEEDDSYDDDNYNNYLLLDSFTNSTPKPEDSFLPPARPSTNRTNSDSSIRMSSNNPFSSALNNGYVHHREPPPPPPVVGGGAGAGAGVAVKSATPPSRPPKDTLAPPTYEEAAGREAARREHAREKHSSSSRSGGVPHRSHSDGSRPHRSHRTDRDRERERSERHRDRDSSGRHHSSHHSKSKRSPSKKQVEPVKSKNLDTIDKLDVTAFFGGGFHHDGPFDACTPHRNKEARLAPVRAYAVDGPNSSIKGANYDPDQHMNMAFGTYNEQNEIVGTRSKVANGTGSKSAEALIKTSRQTGDSLYVPQENPSVVNFDAYVKSEPVHGYQTAGLGSSTFIDGAPAPKHDESLTLNGGGLGRKKSLVQRLRKNSGASDFNSRNRSNDELNTSNSFDSNEGGNSLIRRVKSLKVGRRER